MFGSYRVQRVCDAVTTRADLCRRETTRNGLMVRETASFQFSQIPAAIFPGRAENFLCLMQGNPMAKLHIAIESGPRCIYFVGSGNILTIFD